MREAIGGCTRRLAKPQPAHLPAPLSAGVDNLLDATYAEHISRGGAAVAGYTTTARINEPGAIYWLKIDLSY